MPYSRPRPLPSPLPFLSPTINYKIICYNSDIFTDSWEYFGPSNHFFYLLPLRSLGSSLSFIVSFFLLLILTYYIYPGSCQASTQKLESSVRSFLPREHWSHELLRPVPHIHLSSVIISYENPSFDQETWSCQSLSVRFTMASVTTG